MSANNLPPCRCGDPDRFHSHPCRPLATLESMVLRVEKGDRIGARWLLTHQAPLAGMQFKLGATKIEISGIVRHLRGNDPQEPTEIVLYVEPEGPVPDVVRRERPYGCMCPGHDDLVPVRSEYVRWKETP